MTAPVLDCSVVCAWLLDDEEGSEADAHLEPVAETGTQAPSLFGQQGNQSSQATSSDSPPQLALLAGRAIFGTDCPSSEKDFGAWFAGGA